MESCIVYGFHDENCSKTIRFMLANLKYDKVLYVGYRDHLDAANEKVDVLLFEDVNMANYENYKYLAEPLDAAIVERYSYCETICLRMFDRLEFWMEMPYDKRKVFYLRHLRFWHSIIEKYNVRAFISSNYPHEMFDFIIYSILKGRDASLIFFTQIEFLNRIMVDDGLCRYSALRRSLESGEKRRISDEVLSYIAKKREKVPPQPFYMNGFEKRGGQKRPEALIKEYNKHVARPVDLNSSYLFVALHYQPEMTTSPLAGVFVDQQLILEMLDRYVPDDIWIYVKEHPKQTAIGRNQAFYSEYANSRRLRFIDTGMVTAELIDGAKAVVTCTGTVAMEALIRGKPVLLFGDYYYNLAPGAYTVKTREQCVKAIDWALHEFVYSEEELKNFLQTVYENSFHGFIDNAYRSCYSAADQAANEQNLMSLINTMVIQRR